MSGPYLGQAPPGATAEIFAPGLLTAGGNEPNISFSPDGREFAMTFSTTAFRFLAEPRGVFLKGYMMYSRIENGCWTVPREFPFTPKRTSGNLTGSGATHHWYIPCYRDDPCQKLTIIEVGGSENNQYIGGESKFFQGHGSCLLPCPKRILNTAFPHSNRDI